MTIEEKAYNDSVNFPRGARGPEALLRDRNLVDVAAVLNGEQQLFDNRRLSKKGRKAQLTERIQQLSKQSDGLTAQQDGKLEAIRIIVKELASLEPLLDQGIIPATRVYALQRDAADLDGELGSLIASTAETNGEIAETGLQIIQVDDDQRTEISDQLRQAESELGEYSERLVAAEDEIRQMDIKAPQAISKIAADSTEDQKNGQTYYSFECSFSIPNGQDLVNSRHSRECRWKRSYTPMSVRRSLISLSRSLTRWRVHFERNDWTFAQSSGPAMMIAPNGHQTS